MIFTIRKIITPLLRAPFNQNVRFFSKEAPKKEGGKKDSSKDAAPAAPVIQQPPLSSLAIKWISPNHPSLSPSQLKYYNQGFEDLSISDKQILNGLAEKLLTIQTATFYDAVLKKGSMGTSQLYYTAIDNVSQAQLSQKVRKVRKQV